MTLVTTVGAMNTVTANMRETVKAAHANAVAKGFWDGYEDSIDGRLAKLMLIVSELGEATDPIRNPDLKDNHLPEEDAVGLELADAIIRIFDYCGYYEIDIQDLIEKKMTYNKTRPYKHGKLA